ncbi:tyrosine--tRNA ligase [bacterium]|nr:tyrosine--tRNA ligase [bacterium]
MSQPQFWTDLEERGVIFQKTSESMGTWIDEQLSARQSVKAYCGFDPTAASLHVGNLLAILGLRRLKNAGVLPIAVVGGATGMIGDPSGKSQERQLLGPDDIRRNVEGIRGQLERLFEGSAGEDFLLVNNAEWFDGLTYIQFLRDVGKHFSVNAMMAKESVRARLEDREQGISYTEFSYMLLQAYDFLHLYESLGCQIQCGGSDQWGNITAGIDLIHHKHHGSIAHGCTFPLLTTSSGQKFGKSERGAIYLDPKRTHPYFLFKYFFDTSDADIDRYLKLLTFVSMEEIIAIAKETTNSPEKRVGPKRIALELTSIVHSPAIALACEGLERSMHEDDVDSFETHADELGLLDPATLPTDLDPTTLPVAHRAWAELDGGGLPIIDLAVDIGLFQSKSEVRREIQSGGLRVGGQPVSDVGAAITKESLAGRRVVQVKRGKRQKRMVVFR